MSASPWIDELYAAFVAALPEALREPALTLSATLGLAPSREVPWSEVFSHAITLGAPLLVAEAMPALPDGIARDATMAHLLAVIEAFGTDRIEDGQVAATPALAAVLEHARRARDTALARIGRGAEGYAIAERETLEAIHAERAILARGERVAFARYLAIAHGKQRVGLPASLALARASGWDARRTRCLARLLDAVWVGLQLHDDVIDWQDDLKHGGAWAAALAGEAETPAVLASGVLARMLRGSARRFRAARRRAGVLGAAQLAGWAREREETLGELARREEAAPGFANRAHALSMWARTVLG